MSVTKAEMNPKNWGEADMWIVNTPHGRKTRREIKNIITLWSKDIPCVRLAKLLHVGSSRVIESYLARESAIPKEVGERVGMIMQLKEIRYRRSKQHATCRTWKKGKLDCDC